MTHYQFVFDDLQAAQIMLGLVERYWALDHEIGETAYVQQQTLQDDIAIMVHQIEAHNQRPETDSALDLVVSLAVRECLGETVWLRDPYDPVMLCVASASIEEARQQLIWHKFTKADLARSLRKRPEYEIDSEQTLVREAKATLIDWCYWASQRAIPQRDSALE